MPVFKSSDQLYAVIKTLLVRIGENDPKAESALTDSRLILRLHIHQPDAEITMNGRRNPPVSTYGKSPLLPDLELEIGADALHYILLGQLSFTKALGAGKLKLRGPVWKAFVLEKIFHSLQTIYPHVISEFGVDAPPYQRGS